MKRIVNISPVFAAFFLAFTSQAAVVAVVDSGTDVNHPTLSNKLWTNPAETFEDAVDNDGNGLVDDIHGWNFAENNRDLLDPSVDANAFSPDVYRIFEIQLRSFQGTITEEERQWVVDHKNNQEFMKELMMFGNYFHGTHVAGISSKDTDMARIMGLKIIPTKSPLSIFMSAPFSLYQSMTNPDDFDLIDFLIKQGLNFLAGMQATQLNNISAYLALKQAQVANCSFGTSVEVAKMILKQLLPLILQRDPTEEELTRYGIYFVGQIVERGRGFATTSPGTFFVIAAGNDGADNDVMPDYPANLREPNTISVAATMGHQRLATFSNYGRTKVDIAAPGVGILSGIPGPHQMLRVSGTSQASPYVANIMGRIFDANPRLSHADAKSILMQTVDFKDFLRDKVVSQGIANPDRAILAASLSREMNLSAAIAQARTQVADMEDSEEYKREHLKHMTDDGLLVDVTPLYQ